MTRYKAAAFLDAIAFMCVCVYRKSLSSMLRMLQLCRHCRAVIDPLHTNHCRRK